jgi:hypothetical protein
MKSNILHKYGLPVIACLLFLVIASFLYIHYILTDDTYIYLQYSKHIIHNGEISFNLGTKSYGFTSALWLFLIVFFNLIIKEATIIPPALSAIFSLMSVLIWIKIIKFHFKDSRIKDIFFILFIIILDPNLLKHSFTGLESTASFFLSSLIIYFLINFSYSKTQIFNILTTLGVLFIIRPESIIISLIFLLYLILQLKVKISDIVVCSIPVVLIILLWHLFALKYFGTAVPATFSSKGGMYTLGGRFWKNFFDSIKILAGNYSPYVIILLYALFNRNLVEFKKNNKLIFSLIAGILLIIIFYSLVFNREQVFARYFCIISPFINYIIVLFVIFNYKQKKLKSVLLAVLLLIFALDSINSLVTRQITFAPSEKTEDEIISWVNNNTLMSDVIVRPRIGKIGYITGRKILDPVGLINPEIINYYKSNSISFFYAKYKPDYYIGMEPYLKLIIDHNAAAIKLKSFYYNNSGTIREYIQNNNSYIENIYKIVWNN